MITKKTWEEFRSTGLLWFINTILHMFGWAIVVQIDDGKITEAYPARVKFRGFSEDRNTEGYQLVTEWFMNHANTLYEETWLT